MLQTHRQGLRPRHLQRPVATQAVRGFPVGDRSPAKPGCRGRMDQTSHLRRGPRVGPDVRVRRRQHRRVHSQLGPGPQPAVDVHDSHVDEARPAPGTGQAPQGAHPVLSRRPQ
jgi:hypothetical protein